MAQFNLEETRSNGSTPATEERIWLQSVRQELDDYCVAMEKFATSDPATVMADISSIHARLVGIRVALQRSGSQRANSLRTREVDPLIDALEFQFKCSSRIIALADQEWRMAGGAN